MTHPLLTLADKEHLHTDDLPRALKAAAVNNPKRKNTPYKLADGGGLFLLVLPDREDGQGKRSRLWRYKYRINGKEGLYAIGTYPEIGLAEARKIHRAARWLVQRGQHPLAYFEEQRQRQLEEAALASENTFRAVCEKWLKVDQTLAHGTSRQRRRELEKDVLPRIGHKPISEIRKKELKELVEEVQGRAPEVARNLRNYLVGIFDHAVDAGYVTGSPVPGPDILVKRSQVVHPALSLSQAGQLLRALQTPRCTEQTRTAMHLLILTAVRKSELIGARWSEFDLERAEWRIPKERMKGRQSHFVPLPSQAVNLLKSLRTSSASDLLFPNTKDPRRPMADRSLNALMGRLGFLSEGKPHGFRAMFSTYCNEAGFNPDIIEACLAHQPKDAIRAKYNRAEYLQARREMMQHWADHLDAVCASPNVVSADFQRAA